MLPTICSMYLAIYDKSLSLQLTECDKQQILNIFGSDLSSIEVGMGYLMYCLVPVILLIFLSTIALYFIVDISSIFGILFMLFIGIPFQLFAGYKLSYYTNLRMNCCDKRVQLISEIMRGIRVIKVWNNQMAVMNKINSYRDEELNSISKRNFCLSLIILSNFLIPTIMFLITLSFYFFIFKHSINSNITLFMAMLSILLQVGVRALPMVVGQAVSFLVSCGRVDTFYERRSINNNNLYFKSIQQSNDNDDNIAIQIENATFSWSINDEADTFKLDNISLNINRGRLVAIIGCVGSGKSSLFQSILGEMPCKSIDGINVNLDEIVYCSQTPYIRNVSMRENIILELPFDEIKYKRCIIASSLQSDIQSLPNMDMTIIGDEGVALSGGQKMRVAFARTLYRKQNNNDNYIYLFDDPLSSLDVYVGRSIFLNGIYKYLLNRSNANVYDKANNVTCLMIVNSHLHLIKYFDDIIIIDDGDIKLHTTTKEFLNQQKKPSNLFDQYQHLLPNINLLNEKNTDDEKYDDIDDDLIDNLKIASNSAISGISNDINYTNDYKANWKSFIEFIKCSVTEFDYKGYWFNNTENINLYESVQDVTGKKQNLLKLLCPLLLSVIICCCVPLSDLWILYWNQKIEKHENMTNSTNFFYLSVWFVILFVIAFGTLYSMYLFGKIALKSSKHIHAKSLLNILRANTLFFDVTPRGDIMNPFTTDTNNMDIQFVQGTFQFVLFLSAVIGYFILIMVFIPLSIIPILITIPFVLYFNHKFGASFVSTKLLWSKTNANILTLCSETVSNLASIRCYKLQNFFFCDMKQRVNADRKCIFMYEMLVNWVSLYQEILLNVTLLLVIIVSCYQISLLDSISNTQSITHNKQFVIFAVWCFIAIQQQINIVSRAYCYSKEKFISIMRLLDMEIKTNLNDTIYESKQINHEYRINEENIWPKNGDININEIKLKYRKNFDIVLNIDKPINMSHGSKIGICGRTGSGKSSILVSILRLFEPIINDVVIDNMPISNLGLSDLRSNLSVISQNPLLLSGDLRFNLDPFIQCTDNEIWTALKHVKLSDLVNKREGKLRCDVEENGDNFSLGEKQLLCFARALLEKPSILFMDEATSSMDKSTDNIIQNLLRSEQFKNITVVTIAHRLQTIIDYDYILVLKDGKIIQYDTPNNLLSDHNGHFAKLIKMDKLYHDNAIYNDI